MKLPLESSLAFLAVVVMFKTGSLGWHTLSKWALLSDDDDDEDDGDDDDDDDDEDDDDDDDDE